jgi:hypothetical protein
VLGIAEPEPHGALDLLDGVLDLGFQVLGYALGLVVDGAHLRGYGEPGGTGMPRLVISARFAPFPPRTAFISAFPSALVLLPPKRYTYFFAMIVSLFSDTGAQVEAGKR